MWRSIHGVCVVFTVFLFCFNFCNSLQIHFEDVVLDKLQNEGMKPKDSLEFEVLNTEENVIEIVPEDDNYMLQPNQDDDLNYSETKVKDTLTKLRKIRQAQHGYQSIYPHIPTTQPPYNPYQPSASQQQPQWGNNTYTSLAGYPSNGLTNFSKFEPSPYGAYNPNQNSNQGSYNQGAYNQGSYNSSQPSYNPYQRPPQNQSPYNTSQGSYPTQRPYNTNYSSIYDNYNPYNYNPYQRGNQTQGPYNTTNIYPGGPPLNRPHYFPNRPPSDRPFVRPNGPSGGSNGPPYGGSNILPNGHYPVFNQTNYNPPLDRPHYWSNSPTSDRPFVRPNGPTYGGSNGPPYGGSNILPNGHYPVFNRTNNNNTYYPNHYPYNTNNVYPSGPPSGGQQVRPNLPYGGPNVTPNYHPVFNQTSNPQYPSHNNFGSYPNSNSAGGSYSSQYPQNSYNNTGYPHNTNSYYH